jgi:hypothetical protein
MSIFTPRKIRPVLVFASMEKVAYVIIKNFQAMASPRAVIKDSRLAIKCYFSKMNNGSPVYKETQRIPVTSNRAIL